MSQSGLEPFIHALNTRPWMHPRKANTPLWPRVEQVLLGVGLALRDLDIVHFPHDPDDCDTSLGQPAFIQASQLPFLARVHLLDLIKPIAALHDAASQTQPNLTASNQAQSSVKSPLPIIPAAHPQSDMNPGPSRRHDSNASETSAPQSEINASLMSTREPDVNATSHSALQRVVNALTALTLPATSVETVCAFFLCHKD